MKRLMAFILVALSLLCFTAVAFAESDNNSRASNYFSNYGIAISTPGSGKVTFTMSCSSMGTASQLGISSYSVQKYSSGGWVVVASGGSNYKYNTSSYALSKTLNGVAGEQYRVKCTFLCVKNGTAENKTYTSRTVTAN